MSPDSVRVKDVLNVLLQSKKQNIRDVVEELKKTGLIECLPPVPGFYHKIMVEMEGDFFFFEKSNGSTLVVKKGPTDREILIEFLTFS